MNIREQLNELSKQLFKELQKGEELEIIYYSLHNCLTRYANSSITQNIDQNENTLTMRLRKGKKTLNLTSNSINFESLKNLLKRGEQDLEYVKDDPNILDFLGPQQYEKIEISTEKISNISPEIRREFVQKTINYSKKYDCQSNGTVSNVTDTLFLVNTNELNAYFENSFFSFKFVPKYKDVTSYSSFLCTNLEKFNLENTLHETIELCQKSVNPQEIEEGKYTVIFSPESVANFLEFLSWYGFNTKNIYEKTVLFSNKLNQKIFSENVTFYDDFHEEDFLGCPFDFEGHPRQKVTIVENGIFKNLLLSRKYAKLLNYPSSTGHNLFPEPNLYGVFPINLILKNGSKSMDDIIKDTEDGIYVHNLHYCNLIDPYNLLMTGLTRFGLFRIKNGKLAYPIKNMRFTDAIPRIFSNITELSKDFKVERAFFGTGCKTPAIKVKEFNFSSKTLF